ncbi:MAG: hypothetical protein JXR30_02820, partial [Alphaproteobacteria bacterium]|nr:hypothetical protein [Alphaproteobacteria bacterium]
MFKYIFAIIFFVMSPVFAQEQNPYMYGDRPPTPQESISYYERLAETSQNVQQENDPSQDSVLKDKKSQYYFAVA